MANPAIILLFSGKRKSGKDFICEQIKSVLKKECEIIRISGPLKRLYAEHHKLDWNELMSDGPYKEKYRLDMINWSDQVRKEDPGFFCRAACQEAGPARVWIISDVRRLTDIKWFTENYTSLKTIRIQADLEVRKNRGWKFTEGVDDVTSECDLDHFGTWDFELVNNTPKDGENIVQQIVDMATKDFIERVNAKFKRKSPVSWPTAVRFLYARKFDVNRAVVLFEQHESTRQREGLNNFDPQKEPLFSELLTGKFTVLPNRDANNAAIAVFTAHKHIPANSNHQTTLQGVVYQLDVALQNPLTQQSGIVFIYDMSNSKYANFDYDLSQKILTMLKGGYPAKLKKVLIVTAPLWFKAPFKILRLFVREKLRERVYTVSAAQLLAHIPRESLPAQLGGSLVLDHDGWLEHCLASMSAAPSAPLYADGRTPSPQKRTGAPGDLELGKDAPPDAWSSEEANLNPPSSASSGFSDDDSLHGDGAALTVSQLVDYVRERGRAGLVQEYAEIRARPPDGSFNVPRLRANLQKNRYTDVLCYDHSRVILSELDGDRDSDYIHANFVDGYKQRNAFINTQGPLPRTTPDFWRMVWEQHTLVIVMTTRAMERGRPKCHQYWEPEEDGEAVYGQFTVKTLAVETDPDYTVTTIGLTNRKTDETREVSHWQFTSWPDYGVPSSAKAMLEFLERVRRQQASMVSALEDTWAGHPRGPPIVVHCSAGIGRTGTFCTLDICISRLEDIGTVDVRGTVERIRSQRAYSIQMPDQYIFCHLALIEYALTKGLLQSVDLTGFDQGADEDSD